MEIKNVLVKDIKYAPYNPRKISDEVLSKLKRRIGKKITLDCRDYMAFSIRDSRIRIRGVLESVFDRHFVIARKFGNATVRESFTLIDLCTGEVRLLK